MAQINSIAGDPETNLGTMERIVRRHLDSDIICFPEMSLSGYTTNNPLDYSLRPEDECVARMHRLAKDTGVAIVFGYLEKDPDGLFMRQEIADGSDQPKYYRKTHLGKRESEVFDEGDAIAVFDVKGIRLGIQLCIESHIQEVCSTLRGKGAELVLTPFANGNSGDKRRSVWYSYLPARASDNGMYVACCSAIGDNGMGAVFGGGIIVLGPKGETISEYYGTDEHTITVDIGGKLPRDGPENMANISYYDRRRPELYKI